MKGRSSRACGTTFAEPSTIGSARASLFSRDRPCRPTTSRDTRVPPASPGSACDRCHCSRSGGRPVRSRCGQCSAEPRYAVRIRELSSETSRNRWWWVARQSATHGQAVHAGHARLSRRDSARHVATEASISTLRADAGGADGALARDTVSDYLAALEGLMITEDQPAWAPLVRSRSRVRSASKRHFYRPIARLRSAAGNPRTIAL